MLDRSVLESALEKIAPLRAQLQEAHTRTERDAARYRSLLNLKQYMILRSEDRTELQEQLFLASLSSLGRSYAHVGASVDTLYDQLTSSLQCATIPDERGAAVRHIRIEEAIELASQNATALFGGRSSSRLSKQGTAVMVTLPSHAADTGGTLIRSLAGAGVNAFRINTAHDTPEVWRSMAEVIADINARRGEEERIRIFVDLAGPKIRTGAIRRRRLPITVGSNKTQREVVLLPGKGESRPARTDPITQKRLPATLCIDPDFFKKIRSDKPVKVIDVNGKRGYIYFTEVDAGSARGVIDRKLQLDDSAQLRRKHRTSRLRNIAQQVEPIRLFVGDTLVLSEASEPGRAATRDRLGNTLKPARISCSFPGFSRFVAKGQQLYIDDGKIGLVVSAVGEGEVTCRVTQAKPAGTLLKEEKGINFPDAHIETPAITENDRRNLAEVIGFADMLGLSFCQGPEDVAALQSLLADAGRSDAGIVVKIETRRGVCNMPAILEQLLRCEKSGVMIARGDLAIEVGFRKLALVQEQLLDICDAAHMPVIWATQVLENQMKSNLPSRAEVTDAAMAGRAECVMLNKGVFALDTIDVLRYILHDMHRLFKKNRQLLGKEEWELF